MANLVDKIAEKHIRKDVPEFRVGDTVRVDVWVKEGKKERIQSFEGLVIAKRGGGVSETFTVRKKSGTDTATHGVTFLARRKSTITLIK